MHGLWTSHCSHMKGQENDMTMVHESDGNGFLNPISGFPFSAQLSRLHQLVENWTVGFCFCFFCLSFVALNQVFYRTTCCLWTQSCWPVNLYPSSAGFEHGPRNRGQWPWGHNYDRGPKFRTGKIIIFVRIFFFCMEWAEHKENGGSSYNHLDGCWFQANQLVTAVPGDDG